MTQITDLDYETARVCLQAMRDNATPRTWARAALAYLAHIGLTDRTAYRDLADLDEQTLRVLLREVRAQEASQPASVAQLSAEVTRLRTVAQDRSAQIQSLRARVAELSVVIRERDIGLPRVGRDGVLIYTEEEPALDTYGRRAIADDNSRQGRARKKAKDKSEKPVPIVKPGAKRRFITNNKRKGKIIDE